ncbi:MAG: cation transporting ATPase C-terminal domain-containing protein [Ruminococcus sp.]|nr:cation transporting ATPase C-terminal domain-containing protein [Ruminococcus sp.]
MSPTIETVQKNSHETAAREKKSPAVSPARKRAERIFGGQTYDIARLIMLCSAGLTAVFGDPATSTAIMALITAQAAAGLVRESRSVSAAEKIDRAAEPHVSLRTENGTKSVPHSALHEGDIFEIAEGGIFPRDSIIIETEGLYCDESALTGSVFPAEKTAYDGEEIKDKLGLKYIGYCGTVVVKGRAVCKAEGRGSEVFRREKPPRERTSLLVTESRRRAETVFNITIAATAAISAAAGIIRGGAALEQIPLALAAAAVCIPERLTASAELTSARLRRLLFGKGMIVRDTEALERLGCTELILADLRGTVTERQRSVKKLCIPADNNNCYDFSEVTGRLTFGRSEDGYMAWENSALGETMICAAVCCRARRSRKGNAGARNRVTHYEGDGTGCGADDAALLSLCAACGIDRELLLLSKIGERQDDPAPRCVSVTCRVLGGEIRIYTKGNPETIFGLCGGVFGTDDPTALRSAMKAAELLSEEGLGVTAFCETVGGQTLLLGMAGLWAPIPSQTTEAIRSLRRMGVRTLMFTDDDRTAAKAAAVSAGILTEGKRCCTGSELDSMNDEQIEAVSGAMSVFARCEPRHKARIAGISEEMRLFCAAAVSTAEEAEMLSEKQTLILACENLPDSVKQQAEVIVPQGCLEELSGAVKCGRALYGALRGRACLGVELAMSIMTMLLFSAFSGMKPPVLPVQLLLAALITEPAAASALTLVPPSGKLFGRSPQSGGITGGRRLLSEHLLRGLVTAFSLTGGYTVLLRCGSLTEARTATAAALSLSRLLAVIHICGGEKLPLRTVVSVLISAGAIAAVLTMPISAGAFGFAPLSFPKLMIGMISAVMPSVFFRAARSVRSARLFGLHGKYR